MTQKKLEEKVSEKIQKYHDGNPEKFLRETKKESLKFSRGLMIVLLTGFVFQVEKLTLIITIVMAAIYLVLFISEYDFYLRAKKILTDKQ